MSKQVSQKTVNNVANMLGVLASYMPQKMTRDQKLAAARKMVRSVLTHQAAKSFDKLDEDIKSILQIESIGAIKDSMRKQAVYQNPGYPDNSYATTKVSDTAKDIQIPEDSHYQTKMECVTRLTNEEGLTAEAADRSTLFQLL